MMGLNFMKKLLLAIILVAGLASCSMDEDTPRFDVAFVPIESITFPEQMQPGQTYELEVFYKRPNDCHYFDGFYTEAEGNSQLLAVQTLVIQDAKCESLEDEAPESAMYSFTCPTGDIYTLNPSFTFKIYKGDDENGEGQFETVLIPVAQ